MLLTKCFFMISCLSLGLIFSICWAPGFVAAGGPGFVAAGEHDLGMYQWWEGR